MKWTLPTFFLVSGLLLAGCTSDHLDTGTKQYQTDYSVYDAHREVAPENTGQRGFPAGHPLSHTPTAGHHTYKDSEDDMDGQS